MRELKKNYDEKLAREARIEKIRSDTNNKIEKQLAEDREKRSRLRKDFTRYREAGGKIRYIQDWEDAGCPEK